MEDIKWFIKKFGIIFVILLVMIVSVGIFFEKNVRKIISRGNMGKASTDIRYRVLAGGV